MQKVQDEKRRFLQTCKLKIKQAKEYWYFTHEWDHLVKKDCVTKLAVGIDNHYFLG